jgi:hypothetical protein
MRAGRIMTNLPTRASDHRYGERQVAIRARPYPKRAIGAELATTYAIDLNRPPLLVLGRTSARWEEQRDSGPATGRRKNKAFWNEPWGDVSSRIQAGRGVLGGNTGGRKRFFVSSVTGDGADDRRCHWSVEGDAR